MALKSKKRSGRRVAVGSLDLIRRNFARGDFKQALKDARVGYRQKATPELRSLLEHVYMARAQQLSRQGLREDARRIAQELLDLGITQPSVQSGLPELLLSIGMLDRLPAGRDALTDDHRDRLQVKIADLAVLRPQDAPQGMQEIREDAQRIRSALEAVERGNELAALAQLKGLPRQSPLADWKFFVRGLIAYYRRDESNMLANWNRLDENRAAVKIAAPLKFMAGVASPRQDSQLTSKVSRLEQQATSHRVLGTLLKLRKCAADQDWPQVLRTLKTAGGELQKLDSEVYRRIASWLCGVFINGEQVEELDRLARFAEPPPLDPRWNRARAVVRESSGHHSAEQYWRKYLRDLESVAALSPTQRHLARAMVYLHLARDYADRAVGLRECRCGADHSSRIKDAEAEALEQFNQCLKLAPTYRPGYAGLAKFHGDAGRRSEAAEVYQRWLERTPNDVEALLYLSEHYVACDEPLKARGFAERVRQLKPLDKSVSNLLWSTYVKAARHFACQGQFDQAREELAAADRLQPERSDSYDMLARKAILEIKAGSPKSARHFIEQAHEVIAEPTALWLVMTIEAIRFELPNKETWLYEKRLQAALKRRCRSETAGLLCQMLDAHLQTPQPYQSCDQHVQAVLKYVRRCSRVTWQAEDLRQVCEFLDTAEEYGMVEKLVTRGLKRFPDAAYLHWLTAKAEMSKGPWRCNRLLALDHLQTVVRCGASSNDPRDKQIVDLAKHAQILLENTSPDHDNYDDDYDDEDDFHEGSQFDGMLDDLEGIPRNVILEILEKPCRRMGLDPEEVLRDIERRQSARRRGSRGGK